MGKKKVLTPPTPNINKEEAKEEAINAVVDGVNMNLNVRKEPKVDDGNVLSVIPKGTKVIGKMADQKMVVGTEEDNPLQEGKFKVSGYVFTGWSTKPDSTGDRYQDGDIFGFGSSGYQKKVTLYGVWAKEQ